MNGRTAGRTLVCWVGVGLGVTAAASAQSTRALIEQALDEPTKITLKNVNLGEAVHLLEDQTGVRIVMPNTAMRLVLHGEKTRVQEVVLENMPLRRALDELFSPLGMTFAVRDDHVEIVPTPALRQLGRPPSWAELDTLVYLGGIEPGNDSAALKALGQRLQFQVPVRDAWEVLSEAIRNVGAGSGDEALTLACRNLGWSWSILEDRIVLSPMQERILQQLRRPISIRLNNRPLHDVMQAVGQAANVRVRVESGLLSSLPLTVQRNFSVNTRNQPADQVLDSIAAYTGLGYLIEPEGILFYDPAGVATRPPADEVKLPPGLDDPYVAKIAIPLEDGRTIEWLIRRSELPPDLRERRERDLAAFFEAVRRVDGADEP